MKLSRRSLIAGCAGGVAGVLTSGNGVALAVDKWVKPALWQIETEVLRDARPVRNPVVSTSRREDRNILILPGTGGRTSERALNDVGWLIWNHCDGQHTVVQITERITRYFDIHRAQAHLDCRAFLFHLKLFNAILV